MDPAEICMKIGPAQEPLATETKREESSSERLQHSIEVEIDISAGVLQDHVTPRKPQQTPSVHLLVRGGSAVNSDKEQPQQSLAATDTAIGTNTATVKVEIEISADIMHRQNLAPQQNPQKKSPNTLPTEQATNMKLLTSQCINTAKNKDLNCSECGRNFDSSSQLLIHKRCHSGEQPYTCFECGQKFSRLSTLNKHLKIHCVDKGFSCVHCGHRFYELSNLKQKKKKTHTGEMSLTCAECGRKCNATYYGKHLTSHPYDCHDCGLNFMHLSSLRRHKKKHKVSN